jgi:hypothetical protein
MTWSFSSPGDIQIFRRLRSRDKLTELFESRENLPKTMECNSFTTSLFFTQILIGGSFGKLLLSFGHGGAERVVPETNS